MRFPRRTREIERQEADHATAEVANADAILAMLGEGEPARRMARCGCGRTEPSSKDLAFFKDRSDGSEDAVRSCKHCGYFECAHDSEAMAKNVPNNRQTVIERGLCKGFEPHGTYEFDSYYCGCWGWD